MKHQLMRICSFCLIVCFLLPIAAQAAPITTSPNIEVNIEDMSPQEAERFMDIVNLEVASMSSAFNTDIEASVTKELRDFAGNLYTLIECVPTGYAIYHNDSGNFVELSATSPSPYATENENLYYAGPTQYYTLKDDIYTNTVNGEQYSKAVISEYSSDCDELAQSHMTEADTAVLSYIEEGSFSNAQVPMLAAETAPTYITNAYCISNCETASEMSYFPKSACGYIAAALLMLWYRSTINTTYLTSNNSSGVSYLTLKNNYYVFCGSPSNFTNGQTFSYNLWRWHSPYGQADYTNGEYSTGAGDIAVTLESYVKGKGLNYGYDTDVLPTTSSIIKKLDSRDRPYLLWGKLGTADGATGKINHAVIVYGHFNGLLLCNFGWAGYSCVSISGTWGSGLMLRQ